MKKILLIITLFLITTNSYAKYKVFECKNKEDTLSCSGSCKEAEYEFEFKIDKSSNLVIRSAYLDGKLGVEDVLENCKVIDDKNWICSEESKLEGKYSVLETIYIQRMKDNKYYDYGEQNNFIKKYYRFIFGHCAKKSFF